MLTQFLHYKFYLIFYLLMNAFIFCNNKYITDWGPLLIDNQSLTIRDEEVIHLVDNHILYMNSIFGSPNKELFKIIISDNPQLQSVSNIWDWSLGITKGNTIIMKDISISHISQNRFMQVLRHELNHIYLNRLNAKYNIPRWFEEGFSMYYANENFLSNKLLIANHINNTDMFIIDQLDAKFNSKSKKQFNFAYAYSQVLFNFFIMDYSELILIEVIKDIKSGHIFKDAFYNNTLLTVNNYNIKVIDNIKSNFWWLKLMDFPSFLFIIAPLLLIVAFIIVKIKNYTIIKRWKLEEKLEELKNHEN